VFLLLWIVVFDCYRRLNFVGAVDAYLEAKVAHFEDRYSLSLGSLASVRKEVVMKIKLAAISD
jgi:hypothetical protein